MKIYFDETGKPNLLDGKCISITHSFEFSSSIVLEKTAGIDLEMQRTRKNHQSTKLDTEFSFLPKIKDEILFKITVIWGVKEAIFKIEIK
jgi:phosphopantetheinyl transferase